MNFRRRGPLAMVGMLLLGYLVMPTIIDHFPEVRARADKATDAGVQTIGVAEDGIEKIRDRENYTPEWNTTTTVR